LPETQEFQKRQTAYKISIASVLNSRYVKTEGFQPNYLELDSNRVSRVNVVGIVVDKTVAQQTSLTIDDGTGRISARMFENDSVLDVMQVGDILLIVGRPREFSSEKYTY